VQFTCMDHSHFLLAMCVSVHIGLLTQSAILIQNQAKHDKPGFSFSGIKLDPTSDTPGGSIDPPCKDCTVYKAMANFAYKDGKQADVDTGVYTHHIIISDFSGKNQLMPPVMAPFCPDGSMISALPPMGGMGKKDAGAANPAMGGMSHGGASPARAPKAPAVSYILPIEDVSCLWMKAHFDLECYLIQTSRWRSSCLLHGWHVPQWSF
jgi:hypothetical protein